MFSIKDNALLRRNDKELLRIEPWGKNSLRVRATQRCEFLSDEHSALEAPEKTGADIIIEGNTAVITNGNITCHVSSGGVLL